MLLTCNKCSCRKISDKFPKSNKKKNGYKSICKECYNTYFRKYLKNPEHVARVKRGKCNYRKALHNVKLHLGCCVCGYNKHAAALHFHHIDPTKKCFQISSSTRYGLQILIEEIKKCALVCANCHSEIEAGIKHELTPITLDIIPFFEETKYNSIKS